MNAEPRLVNLDVDRSSIMVGEKKAILFFKNITRLISQHAVLIISTLVSVCTAWLYLSIAPTRLTSANFGGDGGDFLAAILTRGIPHPTGYPTYTMLGILFQQLPISTPVFRGVLASALPTAMGAGLLTGWIGTTLGSKSAAHMLSAAVSGIAWGVAPLLFSQAVIVEVHGLQALFVVLFLWWSTLNLRYSSRTNPKWILGLSFLVGLGFGNHVMIALLAPMALMVWFYLIRRTGNWKLMVAQLCLILIGLLVYIYLPLRAKAYPPINWGNPQNWEGFLWDISGNPYRQLIFGAQTQVLWERIRSVSNLLMDQFSALGLIAGVIGAIHYSFQIKWIRWILVWTFVVYFTFAIGYNTQDSVGYLIPAIMVYAIWIGLAIPTFWSIKWKRVPIGLILTTVVVLSIGLRIPGTRARLDPRARDEPARYAEQFLKDAPQNAIINTTTDQDSFPLLYYHFGLHNRPDLRIVVIPLTQFVWYQETLVHIYPDLIFPSIYAEDIPNADWGQQIIRMNPDRPVCVTGFDVESDSGIAYECTSP